MIENFFNSDVVFVADAFIEEYGGGAERSTEALLSTSPYKSKLHYRGRLSEVFADTNRYLNWTNSKNYTEELN